MGHERVAFVLLRHLSRAIIALAGDRITRYTDGADLSSPLPDNRSVNRKAWERLRPVTGDGFIENQPAPVWREVRIGATDMQRAGCGVIAVYNALVALGEPADLPTLIAGFERDGIMLAGEFGTDPWRIAAFLRSCGFTVRRLDPHDEGTQAPVVVTTFWNDAGSIRGGAHTVALTREPDGRLRSHNCGDHTGFPSVAGFYRRHPTVRPMLVLGIERKDAGLS